MEVCYKLILIMDPIRNKILIWLFWQTLELFPSYLSAATISSLAHLHVVCFWRSYVVYVFFGIGEAKDQYP